MREIVGATIWVLCVSVGWAPLNPAQAGSTFPMDEQLAVGLVDPGELDVPLTAASDLPEVIAATELWNTPSPTTSLLDSSRPAPSQVEDYAAPTLDDQNDSLNWALAPLAEPRRAPSWLEELSAATQYAPPRVRDHEADYEQALQASEEQSGDDPLLSEISDALATDLQFPSLLSAPTNLLVLNNEYAFGGGAYVINQVPEPKGLVSLAVGIVLIVRRRRLALPAKRPASPPSTHHRGERP